MNSPNTIQGSAAKPEAPDKANDNGKNAVAMADADADAIADEQEAARREAARLMGRSCTPKKQEAARLNGQRGGRPKGQSTNEATRQKMREAQRRRREQEKNSPPSHD